MPGIHADKFGGDALVTFHSLHLTWSQWTSVLTENIISKNLKVHITQITPYTSGVKCF